MKRVVTRLLLAVAAICVSVIPSFAETVLRVGMFPNITHAQALVARHMAEEGRCWFAQRVPGVRIEWLSFNAGPSAMEALFAKALDLTYVGPNPALNAFIRAKGKDVRVLAGGVRGGAALVVHGDSALSRPVDFKGKRIATPQLGNTQDIACRAWLKEGGLNVRLTGGDVMVTPTANPDQLPLFMGGHVDGVWTVEPWVSRLEMEAGGKVVYSEPSDTSITTVLAGRLAFMEENPQIVAAFARAHEELTRWILEHPEEAQQAVADELSRMTRRPFPMELVKRAWLRLEFNADISQADFQNSLRQAQDAGFLKEVNNIDGLVSSSRS